MTGDLYYLFGKLMGLFGKDVESRLVFMMTFADGGVPLALKSIKELNLGSATNHFKFNNSALYSNDTDAATRASWGMGVASISEFLKFIASSKPISLQTSVAVIDKRSYLMARAAEMERQMQKSMNASSNISSR